MDRETWEPETLMFLRCSLVGDRVLSKLRMLGVHFHKLHVASVCGFATFVGRRIAAQDITSLPQMLDNIQ
jgi:hypothetical protein